MTQATLPNELRTYLIARKEDVEQALERVLPPAVQGDGDLALAMRYSVLAGGKRLRPILFLAVAEACRAPHLTDELHEAAAALELFHAYSLIHDDLPAMDDDDLRHGKPTCHIAFGEALAILAGDSLQTLGFAVLATKPSGQELAQRRAEAVAIAAEAIGLAGMAGGQAIDLYMTGRSSKAHVRDLTHDTAVATLTDLHSKKTGRLFRASAELGALHAGASRELQRIAARYGEALGLLFQIADDLLDITADAATLGKTAGKDIAQDKLTYPSLFGLEGARRERDRALERAVEAARGLGERSENLIALANFAAHRDR